MAKAKKFTEEDDALLDELGVEVEVKKAATYTPREERIIAGFEEIQRFVEKHGRAPLHGEDRDIFERLYAVRLDRIRASDECRALLASMDDSDLLSEQSNTADDLLDKDVSDDELLEALGVDEMPASDITQIKHVRSRVERNAAREVAQQRPCEDFAQFKPIFETVQKELDAGLRETARYQKDGKFDPGDLFIIGGQKALVAGSLGEAYVNAFEREDQRLRIIYDNGTESNLLMRSLQRALYEEGNRRILPLDAKSPTLFSDQPDDDDIQSGTIYVLRSLSDHPYIKQNRDLIHKIGVTGGSVKARIGNASKDPTYLLADVEIVATYQLANINRTKLEKLLHQFFAGARIDLQLKDRFGANVEPKEWFLVPLPEIERAIKMLMDGSLNGSRYDPEKAHIVKSH